MNNNLTEIQIQITSQLFNKLTLNENGKITIGNLIQFCNENSNLIVAIDPSSITYPNWLNDIYAGKGYDINTKLTLEEFLSLGSEYQELNASEELFNQLNPTPDEIINYDTSEIEYSEPKIKFSDIREYFKSEPTIIPQIPSSVTWLNNLKNKENLTDSSEINLNDLLEYQNQYYYAYWPIIN